MTELKKAKTKLNMNPNKLPPNIWKMLENDTYETAMSVLTIGQLETAITEASNTYYNTDNILLSDSVFNIVVDILRQRSPYSDILDVIGSELPPDAKNKANLPYFLGSMNKIKPGSRALTLWLEKYNKGPYTISEKLDGLSGLLVISMPDNIRKVDDKKSSVNVDLVMKMYTRGNGKIGQDISHLIPFIKPLNDKGKLAIYKYLTENSKNNKSVAIRGELIIKLEKFKTKYGNDYPKTRTFVASVINTKANADKINNQKYRSKATDVEFVAYQVIEPNNLTSCEQFKKMADEWHMNTAKNETIKMLDDVVQLEEMYIDYKVKSEYEIDGIIIADDSRIWPQPKKDNPKHSVAFKMDLEGKDRETTIINIEYNVSKQGYLKPRVKFNPVEIDGDTIRYATGFNAKFIKDNKLGPGAIIRVIKSGDVIPYIKSIVSPSTNGKWQEPTTPYIWNESSVDALVEDPNQMPEYITTRLTYFFQTLDVDGIKQGTVDRLVTAGFDTVDLILSIKPESLVDIDGFGKKAIHNLINAIKNKVLDKTHDINVIMTASGCFPAFGNRKLTAIIHGLLSSAQMQTNTKNTKNTNYIRQLENELINGVANNNFEIITISRLCGIEGIANKTAKMFIKYLPCFHEWLQETRHIKLNSLYDTASQLLNDKTDMDTDIQKNVLKQLDIVSGKNILFTGFRDEQLESKIIKEYGGIMKSSMSVHVELLVVSDYNIKNSKIEKANKIGIPIISKADLAIKLQ